MKDLLGSLEENEPEMDEDEDDDDEMLVMEHEALSKDPGEFSEILQQRISVVLQALCVDMTEQEIDDVRKILENSLKI